MDTAQWPQEVGLVKSMEGMVSSNTCSKPITTEKRARPPKDHAINCPRCNSTNTKFCYYNNYSLTQPRYFCKTCRRYWTEGGTLRNVPVGGGTRKNKRSSASSTNSKKIPDLTSPLNSSQSTSHQNPKIIHEVQDLNLAFRTSQDHYHNMSGFVELLPAGNENHMISSTPSSTASFSELLRSGGTISSRGLNPLVPMPLLDPNTAYPSGFGFHDHLRPPAFNFPLDHGLVAGGYGNMQDGLNDQVGAVKLMFPLEDVKPVPSTDFEHHRGQGDDASGGYWNGMLGGGGSW